MSEEDKRVAELRAMENYKPLMQVKTGNRVAQIIGLIAALQFALSFYMMLPIDLWVKIVGGGLFELAIGIVTSLCIEKPKTIFQLRVNRFSGIIALIAVIQILVGIFTTAPIDTWLKLMLSSLLEEGAALGLYLGVGN